MASCTKHKQRQRHRENGQRNGVREEREKQTEIKKEYGDRKL